MSNLRLFFNFLKETLLDLGDLWEHRSQRVRVAEHLIAYALAILIGCGYLFVAFSLLTGTDWRQSLQVHETIGGVICTAVMAYGCFWGVWVSRTTDKLKPYTEWLGILLINLSAIAGASGILLFVVGFAAQNEGRMAIADGNIIVQGLLFLIVFAYSVSKMIELRLYAKALRQQQAGALA